MICLSCDIHHMSLGTNDQSCLRNETEADVAVRFAQLCARRNISSTLFLTGRLVQEEYNSIRALSALQSIELGGHTYNAFQPQLFHRLCNQLINAHNGPYWYQKRDVQKTIQVISDKMSHNITSWRNHAYLSDRNTLKILSECGLTIMSDGTSVSQTRALRGDTGVYLLPINIIPDHEHLHHGKRSAAYIQRQQRRYRFKWQGAFKNHSYGFDEWFQHWTQQIEQREAQQELSVILIHPICLYLAGGDNALTSVVDFLSDYPSQTMKECLP